MASARAVSTLEVIPSVIPASGSSCCQPMSANAPMGGWSDVKQHSLPLSHLDAALHAVDKKVKTCPRLIFISPGAWSDVIMHSPMNIE